MDQKKFWKLKWKNIEKKSANNFARRSFLLIKNKPFKTLLDLGCGDGRDSVYFAKKGLNITAIDFSESAIKQLQKEICQKKVS